MSSHRPRRKPVRDRVESLEARTLLTGNSFVTLAEYLNALPSTNLQNMPSFAGHSFATLAEYVNSLPSTNLQNMPPLSAAVARPPVATQFNVKDFGAFGDGELHPITQQQLDERGWTNKYKVGDEWDTIAWQEATAAAAPGSTIVVPAGIYQVSSPLTLKSDIDWQGAGSVWRNLASAAIVQDYTSELHNVSMIGFTFHNLVFQFRGAAAGSISDLRFKSCTFSGATNTADPDAVQFYLVRTSNVTIDTCTFSRNEHDVGRGLSIYKSQDVNVVNSKWQGYYVTAIVVAGASYDPITGTFPDESRCVGIRIERNTIVRAEGTYLEDHGIYATGMRDITIANNTISGWSAAATGGAVKIRNGEDIVIRHNRFLRSGILAYTYQEDGSAPEYFKNVSIEGNTIQFESDGLSVANHQGILYWRNFGNPNDGHEQNILIRNNTVSGGVLKIHNADLSAFSVVCNTSSGFLVEGAIDLRLSNLVR